MKTIVFFTALFFTSITSNSQIVTNGSLTGNCTGNGFSAPSCIKGWAASHGTPMVLGNLNNNTWAWLSISKENSEGIYTNYNFTVGKKYEISFKVKAYTSIDSHEAKKQIPTATIRATNGLTSSTSQRKPKIDQTSEVVWSKEVSKSKSFWQIVKITYIPTKDNSQLWFYPSVQNQSKLNENSNLQMEIDDIEITPINENALSAFQATDNASLEDSYNVTYIISNPIYKGQVSNIFTKQIDLKELTLIDLSGNTKRLEFTIADKETIQFIVDETTNSGIYTLKMLRKNGAVITKKIIVQ
ncbi:T9SS type A sorting domain-containing protein [Flavobacterium jejuense]|uniref:T9SS type A sorting domain-containing protein n=1 Tax=Flavobacterium jejuense TaxID=1544455 RepID=A0ABX0IVS5_9FLAO|nr:T9SS type A sorting domain-containing protein [Flavobacterium jejuense]NHN28010.1 T9SS type A sorting domain-containing protein [Flavobacterium jejuense]